MDKKRKRDRDVTESLAFIIDRMATKDDIGELKEQIATVDSKVAGINRRLDTDAMQRTDLKLPRRVHELEEKVYGTGASKHPKQLPL